MWKSSINSILHKIKIFVYIKGLNGSMVLWKEHQVHSEEKEWNIIGVIYFFLIFSATLNQLNAPEYINWIQTALFNTPPTAVMGYYTDRER